MCVGVCACPRAYIWAHCNVQKIDMRWLKCKMNLFRRNKRTPYTPISLFLHNIPGKVFPAGLYPIKICLTKPHVGAAACCVSTAACTSWAHRLQRGRCGLWQEVVLGKRYSKTQQDHWHLLLAYCALIRNNKHSLGLISSWLTDSNQLSRVSLSWFAVINWGARTHRRPGTRHEGKTTFLETVR